MMFVLVPLFLSDCLVLFFQPVAFSKPSMVLGNQYGRDTLPIVFIIYLLTFIKCIYGVCMYLKMLKLPAFGVSYPILCVFFSSLR